MKHLDLFSGIGGFSLAASWVWGAEHEIHSFVEIEPFCQKVLKKHWPNTPIHDDIRTYKHDGTTIDLLTGGFPCQPFSQTGKQRGSKDYRFLWPAMFEVIQETKPCWVIGENVAGLINVELENAISDLEACGYEVEPFNIPACSVGAPHPRERVWIIAHTNDERSQNSGASRGERSPEMDFWWLLQEYIHKAKVITGSDGKSMWGTQSRISRIDDGVPDRVDRNKSIGNDIVPQVVVPIMAAIKLLSTPKQKEGRPID